MNKKFTIRLLGSIMEDDDTDGENAQPIIVEIPVQASSIEYAKEKVTKAVSKLISEVEQEEILRPAQDTPKNPPPSWPFPYRTKDRPAHHQPWRVERAQQTWQNERRRSVEKKSKAEVDHFRKLMEYMREK